MGCGGIGVDDDVDDDDDDDDDDDVMLIVLVCFGVFKNMVEHLA